jgi:uncharacterized glyoxalase superfamily protein PhnB
VRRAAGKAPSEAARRRIELAVRCAPPTDVDTVHARMIGNGYQGHKPLWDAVWGQRFAIIEDPDGNLISLHA